MKKRIFLIISALVMLFAMSGCNDIDDGGADASDTSVTTADTEKPLPESSADELEKPDDGWKYEFDSSFIKDNAIQYVWDRLDEDSRINLGEVMNGIKDVRLFVPLTVGFPKEEAESFLELVTNCSTYYTWAGNRFKIHADENGIVKGLTLNYRIDYESDAVTIAEAIDARLGMIVDSIPEGTDFEKLVYLHDWLVLNCDYSEEAESPFSAYGALIEGRATCQGYADAMHLILDRAGFETMFVTGEGKDTTVKHKWNYVKCSDGKWYIIDPTWDDPENKEDPEYIGYDYLLVSDEVLLKDHAAKYESDYYDVPVADSMDMNYHNMMGYYADNADDAYEILEKQAIAAGKEGRRYLYLRCDDGEKLKSLYNELAKGALGDNKIQNMIIRANEESDASFRTTKWQKSLNEKSGTLTLTLLLEEN